MKNYIDMFSDNNPEDSNDVHDTLTNKFDSQGLDSEWAPRYAKQDREGTIGQRNAKQDREGTFGQRNAREGKHTYYKKPEVLPQPQKFHRIGGQRFPELGKEKPFAFPSNVLQKWADEEVYNRKRQEMGNHRNFLVADSVLTSTAAPFGKPTITRIDCISFRSLLCHT